MKPWTAEQTARRMVVGLALLGILLTGAGVFVCAFSAGRGRYAVIGAAYAATNSMYLVQAAGLAAYLRLRGRRGVRVLRACCGASVAVAVVAGLLSRDALGGMVWLVAPMPIATASLAHALATRRVEVGDDSPLMPGAEYMANLSWKADVAIALVIVVLCLLLFAVLGRIPGPRARREPSAAPREPLEGDSMRDFANLDWDEEHGF